MLRLDKPRAAGFYAEHEGKPFYEGLCAYMTSGPIVVQVLEGEDAIAVNRRLMGATNPVEAAPGTIRADFADLHRRQRRSRLGQRRLPRNGRSSTSSNHRTKSTPAATTC